MDRMNKEELIKLINSLKIDKEEFWVISSGNLTLRGILPNSGDLDLAVTSKGLEQLMNNYDLKEKTNGWFIVNDKVECCCEGARDKAKYPQELIEGIYVQNIKEYLEYLYSSQRQKDIDRIPLVENYIKTLKRSINE